MLSVSRPTALPDVSVTPLPATPIIDECATDRFRINVTVCVAAS